MRLTKEIKKHVLEQVVKQKIMPGVKEVEAQLLDIVVQSLATLYTPKEREWIAQAPSARALSSITSINLTYQKADDDSPVLIFKHDLLNSDRYGHNFSLPNPIKCFSADKYKSAIQTKGKLRDKTLQLIDRLNELQASKNKLVTTIGAALESCTTIKKLVESYPELETFLPEIKQPRQELAIPSDAISLLLRQAC